MGLNFLASSSSFDSYYNSDNSNNNPNPNNYEIIKSIQISHFLIMKIKYHDCINYEGNKILLFENCTLNSLMKQGSIDPHFSENKNYYSPIARFEPTERGWEMANEFVEILIKEK